MIGSSMGGFWAHYFAEQYGLKAVLVNPATQALTLMPAYVGQMLKSYYSETFYVLNDNHINELKQYDTLTITEPKNYWLLAQTGDETLDYTAAVKRYQGCKQTEDIEVLTGLDPVKKRPGMYTETTRPNHLAQEVIDNSVDEALAGHAKTIEVILHKDQSITISDDGRGMPVDLHPEQKKPGVEVILSTLHAGGKFSNKNYQFSGGLHGVGISVVNALSQKLDVTIKRDGIVHQISFSHGELTKPLETIDTCGKRNTGTTVHFLPAAEYFDSHKFSVTNTRKLCELNTHGARWYSR